MFQDSVPAGSYNDPFLSSVWNIWTDAKLLPDDVAFCCLLGVEIFSLWGIVNFKLRLTFISKSNFELGDGEDIWGSIQRSSSYDPRISPGTPGDVPATPFQFLVNGNRLSQEPACRFSTFSNQPSTWCLYGFRNLSGKSICFQPGLWRSSVLTLTRVYSLTQSCQV